MRRCEDEKMWRWEDVKMRGCEDERMWRWEEVKMRGCEDERMWRWEDVKMRRCEDEKMWRWEDVKMRRCEDERMWRWEDVKMRRCEDERMWRWEDVKMRRCEDEKMWRWEDVKMRRCEDERMWRWEDVKMRRCEDEKMWRWEDVKMRECEDEKMWRWEDVKMRDVLQTPTIGRTLRSDALGKKLALAWELIALVWKTAKPMGLLGIGKWAELQAWGRRQKLEDNWNLTTWPVYTCRSDCTCWNIAFRSRCQPQMDPLVATPEKMEKVVWTSAALKSSSWARCETFKGSHSQLHPRFALPGQMFKWFSSKNQQKNIYIEYIYII